MSTTEIARLRIDIESNAGKADKELQQLASTSKETEAAAKRVETAMRQQASTATAAAQATRATAEQTKELASASRQTQAAATQVEGALRRQAAAAGAAAQATRMTAFQTTQLAYQLNDFGVQVLSGQNPLMALVQQGSQLSGTFGGVGNAVRAVGSVLSGARVAIGGVAGGIGALAFAAIKGEQESAKLSRAILLTGNAAGLTRGQVEAYAKSLAQDTSTGVASARATLLALIESGRLGGDALKETARAAQIFQKATGAASEDVTQRFLAMTDGVAKWAEQTNRQYNFLTARQLEYVRSLEDQGRQQEAIIFTMQALATRVGDAANEVGLLEAAWRRVTRAASDAWDAAMAIGRPSTINDQIKGLEAQLALTERLAAANAGVGRGVGPQANAQAELLRQQLQTLKAKRSEEEASAAAQGRAAAGEQARIQFGKLREASLSRQQKLTKELADANALADRAGASAIERETVLAAIRDKYAEKSGSRADPLAEGRRYLENLEQQRERVDQLTASEQALRDIQKGRLGTLTPQLRSAILAAAEELDMSKANAEATREQERAAQMLARARMDLAKASAEEALRMEDVNGYLRDEIEMIGKEGAARTAIIQARLSSAIALKEEELAALGNSEASAVQARALERQIELLRERQELLGRRDQATAADEEAKRVAQSWDAVFSRIGGGLADFVTSGKMKFSDFARSVIQDLIRMQIQASTVRFLDGLTGLGSAAGAASLFGANFSGTQAAAPISSVDLSGFRAGGGPVGAGKVYGVNERGPELLSVGGRDFLMMGSQSGNVTPNHALGGGVVNNIRVEAGATRSEVMAAVQQSLAAANAYTERRLRDYRG